MKCDWTALIDAKTLAGVILGAALIWIGDIVKAWITKSKNAHFLAIRLIPILDQFLDSCYANAFDDGTIQGQPAGKDGTYETQELAPTLVLPADVDWKSINKKLLHRIMFLCTDLYSANKSVMAEEEEHCGDGGEFIAVRQYQYAKVAIKCDDLLKDVRAIINMPGKEYPEWWNPRERCIKYIKKFEVLQNKREELAANTWESMNSQR